MSKRPQLPKPPHGRDPLEPMTNVFFITINTNTYLPNLPQALKQVWQYMVTHIAEFIYGRPGSVLLEPPKVKYNIEIGHKFHKIHLHGRWILKTTGIVFVDLNKCRKFINDNLKQVPGFKRCNFLSELVKEKKTKYKTELEKVDAYIDKEKKKFKDSDEENTSDSDIPSNFNSLSDSESH